jgi:hypothetical protein
MPGMGLVQMSERDLKRIELLTDMLPGWPTMAAVGPPWH